jgi:hypothetical protein
MRQQRDNVLFDQLAGGAAESTIALKRLRVKAYFGA